MAENKTRPTSLSVAVFLESHPAEAQRADALKLIELMQRITGHPPAMWGPSIVGFDTWHYTHPSGRQGDMPIISFSPRKSANVLYGAIGFDGSEAVLAKLGKYTTGKGCLYIPKLSDVDLQTLETLIETAVAATKARHAASPA